MGESLMRIAWSHDDPYYHAWPVLCGAVVYSVGILANLLRGIKKPCPKCFQQELGL